LILPRLFRAWPIG